jgi:hypothetical protein
VAATFVLGVCISLASSSYICSLSAAKLSCVELQSFSTFYADKLRASLFTGFLTLGGFLMSLKTFIIVNMKKEVYDTDEYKKKWLISNPRRQKDTGLLYTPLQNLSHMLYATILFSISTSAAQLTIGLFETFWGSVICVWLASVTIILLLWCLRIIKGNLDVLFIHIEEKQKTNETPTDQSPPAERARRD